MPEVVVVGAGIAGLTAAWALARAGVDVLVLEQRPRTGGIIVTETVDGFVIDGGPDALLVQKPAAVDLCRELGIADRLVPTMPPRTAFVVRNRRLDGATRSVLSGLAHSRAPLHDHATILVVGKSTDGPGALAKRETDRRG